MRIGIALVLMAVLGLGGTALAADKASPAEKYPPEVVRNVTEGCMKAKDQPPDKVQSICSCYATVLQKDIPYADFAKVDAVMKAQGAGGLDAQGKAIMEKNAFDVAYCRQKFHAASSEMEESTFPASGLPALHASCEEFPDVPADQKATFCKCYEGLIRTKISYSDWVLLGLAMQVKGPGALDREETIIFEKVMLTRVNCGGSPPRPVSKSPAKPPAK